MAVVTLESFEPYGSIEQAAVALFEQWGVGKKGKDNGILLLAAMKERKLRIEVGYGLEPIIPDGLAGEIIRISIAPRFKEGRFGDGLYSGAAVVAERVVKGEPAASREL